MKLVTKLKISRLKANSINSVNHKFKRFNKKVNKISKKCLNNKSSMKLISRMYKRHQIISEKYKLLTMRIRKKELH